jgi:DNA gyrase subunit B
MKKNKKEFDYTADDIKVLSFDEHVRLRPQMYFEECFRDKNLDSLTFEMLCHAFDEYFDGKCKRIEIAVAHDFVTINYDAGISLKSSHGISTAEAIMTKIWTCKNEKKHLAVGVEFCRLGIATINAGAERCELTTVCGGKKGIFVFEKVKTISRSIKTTGERNEFTRIMLKPDKTIFDDFKFTIEGVNKNAKQVTSKLKGLEIVITDDRS